MGDTPLIKYEVIDTNKIKKKPRYCKIEKDLVRFPNNEKQKNNGPSPMSYDVQKAVAKSVWANSNQPQWGVTKKESYFTRRPKASPAFQIEGDFI